VPTEAARPAGSVIDGKYEVEGTLGTGGMGVVYRARHKWTHREVAVKVLHADVASSQDTVARFLREARSAATLRHPNVVDVLDMGQDDSGVYLALELLEGTSLGALLRERGKLPLEETLRHLLPVMDALTAAHGRDIVHRDLKPDNIFLARTTKGRVVPKLLDFGIAKIRSADSSISTQAGMIIGTPAYMAPEQVQGAEHVGVATDVWAMGIVTYECLSGVSPYLERLPQASLARILTQDVPPLAERAPELPAAVCDAVHRALKRAPEARYPQIDDFATALRHAAGLPSDFGRSVSVPPGELTPTPSLEHGPTLVSEPPGSGVRHRSGELEGVALDDATPAFLRRRRRWPWLVAAALVAAGAAALLTRSSGPEASEAHVVTPADLPPATPGAEPTTTAAPQAHAPAGTAEPAGDPGAPAATAPVEPSGSTPEASGAAQKAAREAASPKREAAAKRRASKSGARERPPAATTELAPPPPAQPPLVIRPTAPAPLPPTPARPAGSERRAPALDTSF